MSRQHDAPLESTVEAYDAVADVWDRTGGLGLRSPQFAARMRRLVVGLLQPAAGGGLAIDLGAGTGWMIEATAPLFDEVHAIEQSAAMLEACRRRIEQRGLTTVRAHRGDAMSLSGMGDASVDAIYAIGLLDAVAHPDRVLSACVRVLKPGGVLVLSTSNGACPWYAVRDRLFGKGDVRTGRYLTPDDLARSAREAGLDMVAMCMWGAAPPGLSLAPAIRLLDALERVATRMGFSRYLGVLTASFLKPA